MIWRSSTESNCCSCKRLSLVSSISVVLNQETSPFSNTEKKRSVAETISSSEDFEIHRYCRTRYDGEKWYAATHVTFGTIVDVLMGMIRTVKNHGTVLIIHKN